MCVKHYTRWKRYKDPHKTLKKQSTKRISAIDGQKYCDLCVATKPVTEFYRHAGRPDGTSDYCRACTSARAEAKKPRRDPRDLRPIEEKDAIYLAGFFDGEGSVLIYKRKHLVPKGKTHPYNLRITISNTHEGVIQWIQSTFGGCVVKYAASKSKTKRADAWKWTASSNVAAHILRAMHPHLIIKKRQAEVALEFQEMVSCFKSKKHPGSYGQPSIPEDEIAMRDRLADRLIELRLADKQYT